MKLEVAKFNPCSLSTPIFVTKKQDFVQKKRSMTTWNDKASAIIIVRNKKNIFSSSYYGAYILTTFKAFLFFCFCVVCFLILVTRVCYFWTLLAVTPLSNQHTYELLLCESNSPVQFCPFPVYPGWQSHTCDPKVLVQFAFSWQEWFPLHSSTSIN